MHKSEILLSGFWGAHRLLTRSENKTSLPPRSNCGRKHIQETSMRPAFDPAAGNGRAHPFETSRQPVAADVAIIGAGPVGLMIANMLGLQGVRVVLIEKLAQI